MGFWWILHILRQALAATPWSKQRTLFFVTSTLLEPVGIIGPWCWIQVWKKQLEPKMPWPCCSHCSAFCCGNNHHNWIITIPFFWFQMQQSSEHSRTCSILLALDSIFSGQSSKTGDISRLQELLWVMLTWLYHVIPTNNLKHPQAFKLTSTFYFRAFREVFGHFR